MDGKRLRTHLAFALMQLPMPRRWRSLFARLGGVHVGKRVFIGRRVRFDTMYPGLITLEDDVHITDDCLFLTHRLDTSADWIVWKPAAIHIGEKAFIGSRSVFPGGCRVGKKAVVGAGSVVTRDIPDEEIWAGNPAKFIRRRGAQAVGNFPGSLQ